MRASKTFLASMREGSETNESDAGNSHEIRAPVAHVLHSLCIIMQPVAIAISTLTLSARSTLRLLSPRAEPPVNPSWRAKAPKLRDYLIGAHRRKVFGKNGAIAGVLIHWRRVAPNSVNSHRAAGIYSLEGTLRRGKGRTALC